MKIRELEEKNRVFDTLLGIAEQKVHDQQVAREQVRRAKEN